jgi:hypothetical protein
MASDRLLEEPLIFQGETQQEDITVGVNRARFRIGQNL